MLMIERNNLINEFVHYIESDILKLTTDILTEEEDLKEVIPYIKKEIPFSDFDLDYFIELLQKYLFKDSNNIQSNDLKKRISLLCQQM